MKTYLFVLIALIAQAVFAHDGYYNKSTFYGCPEECHTQKDPKCEIGLPSNGFFVALHERYFKSEPYPYCGQHYVGMIIDEKAAGKYKLVRGKVVDQCGTCAETQVDLSSPMFASIARKTTGVVDMIYVIVDSNGKITEGPVYNKSSLASFAKKQNVSQSDILTSFKQAAKNMNQQGLSGMAQYPWKSGSFNKEEKKTTTTAKKTTTKKTTTTLKKTTQKTTTAHKNTANVKITQKVVKTSKVEKTTQKPIVTSVVKKPVVTSVAQKPVVVTSAAQKPVVVTSAAQKPVATSAPVPKPAATSVAAKVEKPATTTIAQKPVEKVVEEEEDHEKATDAPVTAGIIGCGVLGAAGVGLVMLKRKSPQKYDELKQKFPEAFGTVKRSISRGASTIKRGVSRSVSRRNTPAETPLPASYTFTLNNEDGLPRVALYDDPYPTKTHGSQHW